MKLNKQQEILQFIQNKLENEGSRAVYVSAL